MTITIAHATTPRQRFHLDDMLFQRIELFQQALLIHGGNWCQRPWGHWRALVEHTRQLGGYYESWRCEVCIDGRLEIGLDSCCIRTATCRTDVDGQIGDRLASVLHKGSLNPPSLQLPCLPSLFAPTEQKRDEKDKEGD